MPCFNTSSLCSAPHCVACQIIVEAAILTTTTTMTGISPKESLISVTIHILIQFPNNLCSLQ